MNALLTVFRHELRRLVRERATPVLALLFASSCLYAAWNGQRWAGQRGEALRQIAIDLQESRDDSRARAVAAAAAQPGRTLSQGSVSANVWYQPTLPLRPLAPLAIGQGDGYPFDVRFHPVSPRTLFTPREASLSNPAALASGSFDLAFVIVYLLPIFVLALTYDFWIRERERGTARLLLAQPISPWMLFAGKAAALGGAVLLGLATLVGVALLTFGGAGGPSGSALAALGVTILLYGAFWVAVALAVNVLVRHAAGAALACGAIWLGVIALLPALLTAAVDLTHPAPSSAAYSNRLRETELERQNARRQPATPAGSTAEREDRNAALRRTLSRVTEDMAAYGLVRDAFRAQEHARRNLAHRLRFASPATAVQDSLERLAGTDATRAVAFQQQAWNFAQGLRAHVEANLNETSSEDLARLYAGVPAFRFVEPAATEVRQALAANAAALLGFLVALGTVIGNGLQRTRLVDDDPP